ncbi:MAG: response regulator transcription factor, partial [Chloroflexi bacterium]
MIRVLVADDHPVVRHGLCTMLEIEDDIVVVGRAGDGEEAVEQFLQTRPDITLMDVQMPNVDGIEALRRIREQDPSARVIVLTTYRNEDYIFPSLRAGARGYLLKDASREELAAAVRKVFDGQSLLDPQVAETVSNAPRQGALTARELEVLKLMAEQQSNAGIAQQLFVSENTVKTHVSNILAKLGCSDRAGAVLTAWKQR